MNDNYTAIKVRLYPTKEQEAMFYKHANCCRFIWNYMLALQIKNCKEGNKHIQEYGMYNLLPELKNEEYSWLNEVSAASLQIICSDLHKAYVSFFKGISKHPKFKCKHKAKIAFPICSIISKFSFTDNNTVHIQKIGKVKYKTDRDNLIPKGTTNKFYNPRIKFINNKWILSFGIEYENQVLKDPIGRVGIDLGIKKLATVSYFYNDYNGNDYEFYRNINKDNEMKRLERRKIHYQRVMARKRRVNNNYKVKCEDGRVRTYHSNNYKKVRKLYQDIEARIANKRLDCIHKITKHIISLNPEVITMEDLKIKNMLKNPNLAPEIQKANWYKFRTIMEYKAKRNGIDFQLAPWWFPSSKTCCRCKHKKKKLGLDERIYVCKKCGLEIDRDLNAAINLQWFNYNRI